MYYQAGASGRVALCWLMGHWRDALVPQTLRFYDNTVLLFQVSMSSAASYYYLSRYTETMTRAQDLDRWSYLDTDGGEYDQSTDPNGP